MGLSFAGVWLVALSYRRKEEGDERFGGQWTEFDPMGAQQKWRFISSLDGNLPICH